MCFFAYTALDLIIRCTFFFSRDVRFCAVFASFFFCALHCCVFVMMTFVTLNDFACFIEHRTSFQLFFDHDVVVQHVIIHF